MAWQWESPVPLREGNRASGIFVITSTPPKTSQTRFEYQTARAEAALWWRARLLGIHLPPTCNVILSKGLSL